ncbi:uncharacterized protein TNCV_3107091 [Trichonephila clavipes]|nr:uncharacterized protein TNCV_3107091 [Trichonephila clavipes]
MQQLWLLKLEWHEKLPVPVATEGVSFVESLPVLEKLKIPRFVLSENLESIILHGFSDVSEKGIGAVTYVSVINNDDRLGQLMCSKSRVAPLKTLTIPRFLLNARSSKNKRVSGPLTFKEINQAELWLIKLVQKAEFSNEIKSLLRGKPVHRSSKLSALNCFVDENNIIRVGGRPQSSPLSKNQKYPIVLPSEHAVTLMIIKYYHDRVVVYRVSSPQVLGSINCLGKTVHEIGTSVHAPQRPMITYIGMGIVVPGPHGLLCN